MPGYMFRVVHLDQVHGFSELIANLKSIPGRWNDRVNVQGIPNFLEAENGFQAEAVHPGG